MEQLDRKLVAPSPMCLWHLDCGVSFVSAAFCNSTAATKLQLQ
jgi:hypothetical protein